MEVVSFGQFLNAFGDPMVCVGFHSFPGEGARAVMTGYYENKPRRHAKRREEKTKKICVICVICGFFFFIVFG
jgi:hypothetical protein